MERITAAEAPEFFLHHGFIDRIWSDWQNRGPDYLTIFFANLTDPMEGTEYSPSDFIDNRNLPNLESPEGKTCILYQAPLIPVYPVVWKLLQGKTRQQILKIPRYPLKPLTERAMRFFPCQPRRAKKSQRNSARIGTTFQAKGYCFSFWRGQESWIQIGLSSTHQGKEALIH